VEDLWKSGYSATSYYNANAKLKAVVDRIAKGFNGESFANIANYFLTGNYSVADPYMCLADFDSYYRTYQTCVSDYKDRAAWTSRAILNIAAAGHFASDRSIREYAENIWNLEQVTE
jgi:starch phosphorylase